MHEDEGAEGRAAPPPAPGGSPWTSGSPPPAPPFPGPGPGGRPGAPTTGWGTPSAATPPEWGPASPGAQVGWERPAPGANGCLRACLVVGAILVVLAIAGVVALSIVGGRIAEQIRRDPASVFGGQCTLATSSEVSSALEQDVEVLKLEGLAGGTMGNVLDRRLLPDADDCWIVSQTGLTGRIAVADGNGAAAFRDARAEAEGHFLRSDQPGFGDEAFCTDFDAARSAGVFVRFGDRLAYVSVIERGIGADEACGLARTIAATLRP